MSGAAGSTESAGARLEGERLAALARYDVLDSPAEASFDRITALVRSILGVPMAAVSLIDRDRQWFKSRPGLDVQQTPRNLAFCNYTVRGGVPFVVPDARTDDRFADNPLVTGAPSIGAYAGVPLTSRDGYHIGTLCALDAAPRGFSAREVEILTGLASIVVDELELRRIACHDHLTGALARRAFLAEVEGAISRRDRYARPAALVLFDLDNFKTINDVRGHAAGDAVLRAVAAACRDMLRTSDVFGRVGGEEFGLLLPELDPDEALAAAERFRLGIVAAPGTGVTASFGVAPLTSGIGIVSTWLAVADEALFAAKRAGRNCCRLTLPDIVVAA